MLTRILHQSAEVRCLITTADAEAAVRLYNASDRRRASPADCLIAAVAIAHDTELLTGTLEFFVPFFPSGSNWLRNSKKYFPPPQRPK